MISNELLLRLQDRYEGRLDELIELLDISLEQFAKKFYEEIEANAEELDLV